MTNPEIKRSGEKRPKTVTVSEAEKLLRDAGFTKKEKKQGAGNGKHEIYTHPKIQKEYTLSRGSSKSMSRGATADLFKIIDLLS